MSLESKLESKMVESKMGGSDTGRYSRPYEVGLATGTCKKDYVLACLGAQSGYETAGRMLFKLSPNRENGQSFTVATKDHCVADAGKTLCYALEIRKKP